jgi:hypothetical protein
MLPNSLPKTPDSARLQCGAAWRANTSATGAPIRRFYTHRFPADRLHSRCCAGSLLTTQSSNNEDQRHLRRGSARPGM